MRFVHLSDLHIGKRVNEFSMLEDQRYILNQILNIIRDNEADAVIIAGDVYDKSVPSAEAVQLFDDFLADLSAGGFKVFVISGNHDSPERIAFGGRIMQGKGVYMSPVYSKDIRPITLEDAFGEVNVYMLPFIRPANVKAAFAEKMQCVGTEAEVADIEDLQDEKSVGVEIDSYTAALGLAITNMKVDENKRNILVAHQFVTGGVHCESDDIYVGGMDNVNAEVFEPFDYVALGHLHGPQHVGRESIRYCGTPLKYSFSEVHHKKTVTIVDVLEKSKVNISTVPLTPLRDMKELRGTYMELTSRSFYEGMNTEDYFHVILTDEDAVPYAVANLRTIYPNIMKLDYDNIRTRANGSVPQARDVQEISPVSLFAELYRYQHSKDMSSEQEEFVQQLAEEIWGKSNETD